MPINILMPALSPTMTEGKLAKWLVAEGDTVESGDVIAEIETDKATMEVEAVDEGTIGKIVIAGGTDAVAVNEVIAVLLEEGEDASDMDAAPAAPAPTPVAAAQDTAPSAPSAPAAPTNMTAPVSNAGNRIFASPLAKRMAAQNGLDLTQLNGTGPYGRIVKSDILKALEGGVSAVATASAAPASSTGTAMPTASGPSAKDLADMLDIPYQLQENSGMRKTIAKRLLESKQTVPHYYLAADCRLDKLLALRKELNDSANGAYKISVNDFIVKACAIALKQVPEANVAWMDDAMVVYERADISVAVATEGGLITPVVKDADQKSLKAISAEVKDLALRARDGKLKPEEYQGGTFSLSNLGMFGIKQFNAIINPPQACIMAVGAGEKRPVVDENGDIVAATVMTCTASLDHRAIDGAVGAQFVDAFKKLIENPMSILV